MNQKTVKLKKCRPTHCKTFMRMYTKFSEKQPADAFVVNCPYRRKDNYCQNTTENLNVCLLPQQPLVEVQLWNVPAIAVKLLKREADKKP